jgi:oligopeptide/dipeptide ABC transporter ATP-binding protein
VQLNHQLNGRSESATVSTAGHTALNADSLGASVSMFYGVPRAFTHFIYVAIAGVGLPLWNFFRGRGFRAVHQCHAPGLVVGGGIIFVTHDLGLIGNLCDQLAVFYGGSVVEAGAKQEIFTQPAHPYTKALLRAIPMLGHKAERLHSIPGEPPNVAQLPAGCPFHPRCEYALDVCRSGDPPPAFTLPDAPRVGCWLWENEHGGKPTRRA